MKQIFSRNDQLDNLLILLLIKFKNFEIVIHVFHDRGTFLWIGAKDIPNTNLKWFNDFPRAMQKLVIISPILFSDYILNLIE